MKLAIIIFVHLIGLTLLLFLGVSLNTFLQSHAGVISVLSVAVGLYATAVNILYHRNRRLYLFVNRVLLKVRRTHTYWQPSFDLELSQSQDLSNDWIQMVWKILQEGRFGVAKKRDETPTTLKVDLDSLTVLVFRRDDLHLHVHFDRKMLVPAHLYDTYRKRLASLVEAVNGVVKPVSVRYGLQIAFGDGVRNPYYGFFVNRVPSDLLQDFQVVFQLSEQSACRIEAGADHVNIEGTSFVEFFDALTEVLSLRAVPGGATK